MGCGWWLYPGGENGNVGRGEEVHRMRAGQAIADHIALLLLKWRGGAGRDGEGVGGIPGNLSPGVSGVVLTVEPSGVFSAVSEAVPTPHVSFPAILRHSDPEGPLHQRQCPLHLVLPCLW